MNISKVDAGLEQKVFHGGGSELRRGLEGWNGREA